MKISVFNKTTGRILRTVTTPVGMGWLQCDYNTEDWIEGEYRDDRFYVENYTPVAMPPRPSPHHVFSYATKEWKDPRTPETEWPLVRAERNRLLSACDWTQLPDVPLPTREAWAAYRQALRDVTSQPDPFNIVWPTPPG